MTRRARPINLAAAAGGQRRTRPVNRAQQLGAHDWYRISNSTDSTGTEVAEVSIYDEIGYFGTTAAQFLDELNAITAPKINVRINTPGGDVFDGVAIMNALLRHPADVTTYVDGYAASIGSVILQAGDVRIASRISQVMIHDASALCVGNAADMNACAALLDSVSDMIAQVYADRAGGSPAAWRSAMRAETWYGSDEAQAAGLVDAIQGGPVQQEEETADAATDRFDLSVFNYAGRRHAPAPPVWNYNPDDFRAVIRERVAARASTEGR